MAEWRLAGPEPAFSTVAFFRDHVWVPPSWQAGHAERTAMTAQVIQAAVAEYVPVTLSDLGCGDGSLLELITHLPVRMWGYDAGQANIQIAQGKGLDVREGDILGPGLEYGELVTCCEVLEHLDDPHGFLKTLPGKLLVTTSPAAETPDWHYEHHAWAWDHDGYTDMITGAGWQVIFTEACTGGRNTFSGVTGIQAFQAVLARRP